MFPYSEQDIRAAYTATDWSPSPGVWFFCGDGGCACPMGALYAMRHGQAALEAILGLEGESDADHDIEALIGDGLGLTAAQVTSFSAGYDLVSGDPSGWANEGITEAFVAGRAIRAAVGPMETPA